MNSANPYSLIETKVVETTQETPTIRTIKLRPSRPISFAAGQFVALTIPGIGEAPFTPSSPPAEKDLIQLTIMKVGKVTERVHKLKVGETVGLRGPLGSAYPLDKFKDQEVLVVGGGCGFAPLRSLMYEFFAMSGQLRRLYFRGGCRSSKELVYREEMETWGKRKDLDLKLSVDVGDPGWTGSVGVVTTILDDIKMDFASGIGVVCGPPVMMKHTARKLLEMGIRPDRLYVSMEKNMSCGIGKCGHCRLGNFYCCEDGPVFQFDQIQHLPEIWD